ncbi:MAG TPA: GH25 family lysozyme [Mycobacteriales bacterium]|jgi:GH25 family lysozyme M1 (1,4-beta-N-acetylmuramidase)|nr:GH25 family lysozyme [Mycobacteriales bacterium]
MTDLLIADVNNARIVTDWAAYKAFSPVVIAKMTQGTSYLAPSFAKHRAGAAKAGLRAFGAYHFWEPGEDPVAQAKNAVRAIGTLASAPLEWLILDVETGDDFDAYEAFCKTADAALGRLTWLYGGRQLQGKLPHRPRWVARYKDQTPNPKWQPDIGEVLWQFTDQYPVPGVTPSSADCSVYRGTADDLITFIRGGRMATLDKDDLAAIDTIIRKALNEGCGTGQTSWGSTSKATLASVQANHNDLAEIKKMISNLK